MGQIHTMDKSNSFLLGMYEKSMPSSLSWKEKLECAKESGFDWIEISIDENEEKIARLDWTEEEKNRLLILENEIGIPIHSMCLSAHRKYPLGDPDPSIVAKSLDIIQKAINFAADIGIRYIQLAGYDVYYKQSNEQTRSNFLKNLRIAVSLAAEKGVILGFETMETEFMDTVEKAMNYVS